MHRSRLHHLPGARQVAGSDQVVIMSPVHSSSAIRVPSNDGIGPQPQNIADLRLLRNLGAAKPPAGSAVVLQLVGGAEGVRALLLRSLPKLLGPNSAQLRGPSTA
mmetsp:Transcript_713/g.2119  ORF Transcript_713/g.2119 Transcript_713/m.2119 type:complete len:105 (-) Transcript_713:1106-1420(-)